MHSSGKRLYRCLLFTGSANDTNHLSLWKNSAACDKIDVIAMDGQEVFCVKVFKNLFQKQNRSKENTAKEPRFKLGDGFYMEFEEVSNGFGGYRMINVWLLKTEDPSFRRCIVNQHGGMVNFPGIEQGDWAKNLKYPMMNKVQFGFWISAYQDGKASVAWTLQPDGRYFEDEYGFGGENLEEITLYSHIDTNGDFIEPFQYR